MNNNDESKLNPEADEHPPFQEIPVDQPPREPPPASDSPPDASPRPPSDPAPRPSSTPDYEILRLIGHGAYGEVYLAREAGGTYRAVKVIFRESFDHDRPFEREYEGIRKFQVVSRSYANQVQVYAVGRRDEPRQFYYVMELADDQDHGQTIHPDTYIPKTLRSELKRRGRLPVKECVSLGLVLARALENLHENGLIHRDVKPGNIIYVNGLPKLADIGLVTNAAVSVSHVGTEGFIPPEGPGSPQADIYSLGKVLYELCTGRDRMDFPELPTNVGELPDREMLLELNVVIDKACKSDPRQRYANTGQMIQELSLLACGKSVRQHRARKRRRSIAAKAALALTAAGIVTGLGVGLLIGFGIWHFGAGKPNFPRPDKPQVDTKSQNQLHFSYDTGPGALERRMTGRLNDPQGLWNALVFLQPPPGGRGAYGRLGDDNLLGREPGYGLRQMGQLARKHLIVDSLYVKQPSMGWGSAGVQSGIFTNADELNDTTIGWVFWDLRGRFETDLREFLRTNNTGTNGFATPATGAAGSRTTPGVSGSGCVTPPSGLVAWWPGEGAANDIVGGNNGIWGSAPFASAPGMVGQAMSFNGVDDWVDLGDPEALKLTQSLTIEGWIKVNGWPGPQNSGETILFRGDDRPDYDPYFVNVTRGGLIFRIRDAKNAVADVAAPVTLREFFHFAATLDDNSGRLRLYLNGAVVAEKVTSIRPFRDLDPNLRAGVTIGNVSQRPNHRWNSPFNGLIDELSVYSRALSSNEVTAIYAAGAAGKCAPPVITNQPQNQVAYGRQASNEHEDTHAVSASLRPPVAAKLVWIKPGTFMMGTSDLDPTGETTDRPRHLVTLTQGFWMAKYEVTQDEFGSVMGYNPSNFKPKLSRPVEGVSWFQALAFCDRVTQSERAAGRLPAGYVYRLPSEAEWEYACRAGSQTRYSFGDSDADLGKYAWCYTNCGDTTHAVGQKLPNAWGLYDMYGNVWEMCYDWFGPCTAQPVTDPEGPPVGVARVDRGGSINMTDIRGFHLAERAGMEPTHRTDANRGFRVVLALPLKSDRACRGPAISPPPGIMVAPRCEAIARLPGKTLWLKAGIGIVADGTNGLGAQVTRWADQSGKGHDAISFGPSMPSMIWNGPGRQPSVYSDGVDDMMNITGLGNLIESQTNFTVIVKCQMDHGGAGMQEILANWTAIPAFYFGRLGTQWRFTDLWGPYVAQGSHVSIDRPIIMTFRSSCKDAEIFENSSLQTHLGGPLQSADWGRINPEPPWVLGRQGTTDRKDGIRFESFKGHIFELVVFDRCLTDSERAEVERCLGVTVPAAEFARDWLVLGPLKYQGEPGAGLDKAMWPAQRTPVEGERANGLAWRRWRSAEDCIDLRAACGASGHTVACAFARLHSNQAQSAVLYLGYDDSIIAFVNGVEKHRFVGGHMPFSDDTAVPISLRKGENTVLLKEADIAGGWCFYARVGDEMRQRLKGVNWVP